MTQPNILFLITDQQRADTLGCYGNQICRTPNIDRLAEEGVRFSHAFTPTSICSPARASLLTGVMPHKHKLLANFERNVGYLTELPEGLTPYSVHLRAAGYNVGTVGKWHVGEERGPEAYGFDGPHFPGWGPPVQEETYRQYLERNGYPPFAPRDLVRGRFPNGAPGNVIAGIYDGPAEGLFDAFITETAIAQMAEYAADGRPFFLACQWFGPHLPYFLPREDMQRYPAREIPLPVSMADDFAHKPRVQAAYAAHWSFDSFSREEWQEIIAADWGYVSLLDREVGKILAALERLGLTENTVVIFTTDHGAFNGAHRMQDKGPAMYDDTYHVPLIVRMPKAIGAEVEGVEERMVSLVDLTPTFLDLAGAPIPQEYDGQSLLPLLRNEGVAWRDHIVAEFHGHHFPYPQRMIRTPRYKLVVNPPDIDELYDLERDPDEMINEIDNPRYAEVRRELATRLYRDLRAAGDNFYHWMTSMEPVDAGTVDASLSQYSV